MDGDRFDQLTRVLAGARSRRSALKQLAAGAIAGAAATFNARDAFAAHRCRSIGQLCRKGGDCCSGSCGAPDLYGRSRCVCSSTQCCGDGDCSAQNTECTTYHCVAGACIASFKPNGTATSSQIAGDCQKNVCNGAGTIISIADDTDVPVDGDDCTDDVCTSGTPGNPYSTSGTACGQSGGTVCDGAGNCVGCVQDTDCTGSDICCDNVCVDSTIDGNCGACGNTCVGGETCCDGYCTDTSGDEQNCGSCGNTCSDLCCNGTCVDTTGDMNNCGSCDNYCSDACCNSTCVDTTTDSSNCGYCDNYCSDACCNSTCVDTTTDPNNCGSCDNPCSDLCCNSTCIDSSSDNANCGSCGTDCAGDTCCGGSCTDTNIDDYNCGSCGNNCTEVGQICDGSGQCIDCVTNADCANPLVCVNNACVGCLADGDSCDEPADCCSQYCSGTCYTP